MALFECKACGKVREGTQGGRCKPKVCECGAEGKFEKVVEAAKEEKK
ncbi:MAG TPA: hypothetical protein VD969_26950 [Symbiobacteriaceae bacterium]|nr:hypothetical protein [Symbiobacteriaceae bacterium]